MMWCSICNQKIKNSDPSVLFVGVNSDDKNICESCDRKIEVLYSSADREKKLALCEFFSNKAKCCDDPEVSRYLKEMLRKGGYEEPEEPGDQGEVESESGWVTLLRFIAWIEIIGGCIGSIILGAGLGEVFDEPALGVGIALVGIITSFILSAGVMVFLDVASDIRKIRGWSKYICQTDKKIKK